MLTEELVQAMNAVNCERKRQVIIEGWSEDHDDKHTSGELGHAALAYYNGDASLFPKGWCIQWFKPSNRKRDLEKAGALLQAEIDRLERLKKKVIIELSELM